MTRFFPTIKLMLSRNITVLLNFWQWSHKPEVFCDTETEHYSHLNAVLRTTGILEKAEKELN